MSSEITIAQLQPILREAGAAAAAALTKLDGGTQDVFAVDCADGTRLVLKTFADGRPWTPRKDAYAAGLLGVLNLPVTRWLLIDESRTRLPVRFALSTWLPGVTVDSLKDDPDAADLHRQMGALIRTLHAVRMPGYGRIDAAGVVTPAASNAEFLRTMFAESFDKFRHYGGDGALADRLAGIVAARFDAAVHSKGPVFAHDDVHPGNVLAQRGADGRLRLSGLIDFGNARAADAVYDLAKCLFISEHMAPGCGAAMREGYGPIDHPDPDGALWFYTLLHRMMMWWWLRSTGAKADEGSLPGLIGDLEAMAAQGSGTPSPPPSPPLRGGEGGFG